MKLGILGTGMIVQDVLPVFYDLQPESISILGTERSVELTESLKETYSMDRTYYDYDALLESDVDTVYVALPNHLHFSYAKKALEHGKHVLVEKPATTCLRDFLELRRLAEDKKLVLIECMNLHHLPAYRDLKQNLPAIGQIRMVSLNYSQYSSRYDAFLAGELPPAFDVKRSGGALMDINYYNIHFAAGLFGKPEQVHYSANLQRGVDTSGVLLLVYPGFQVVCIGAKDCRSSTLSSIQGEKGSFYVPTPANQMTAYTLALGKAVPETKSFPGGHRLAPEMQECMRIVDEKDLTACAALMDASEQALGIIDEARRQLGLTV